MNSCSNSILDVTIIAFLTFKISSKLSWLTSTEHPKLQVVMIVEELVTSVGDTLEQWLRWG